jgi:hypothetical protein
VLGGAEGQLVCIVTVSVTGIHPGADGLRVKLELGLDQGPGSLRRRLKLVDFEEYDGTSVL